MADWAFWAAVAGMAAAVTLILCRAVLRGSPVAPSDADLALYRAQLAEVDRDVARGTLDAAEAQRTRAEIARRLLAADRGAADTAPAPVAAGRVALVAVAGAVLLAVWLYDRLGVPGYPDLPLTARLAEADARMQARPSQQEAVAARPAPPALPPPDAAFADLMTRLRAAVITRPDDLRGQELLARNEAALGNLAAAEAAQVQVLTLKGAAGTGQDHASLAEIRIRAAGGYVSPQAEADLVAALQKDPENGVARYFSGLMFAQGGRFDRAFSLWSALLAAGPPEAPWIAPIREQIAEVAARAGVAFALPDIAGPSAAEVADAAGQSPEAQAAMVEGMVAQLSDRLANEGGSPEEWAQLIRALGVLGRTDEAAAIHTEAKVRFAGQTSALSFLAEAALAAGLAP